MNKNSKKVVSISEHKESASLYEDALMVFFKKHKKKFLQAGLAVLLAFMVVQVIDGYRNYQTKKEQEAFAATTNQEERLAFADKYPRSSLAGVVWMEAADAAYGKQDYSSAKNYYKRAATNLVNTPFATQAQLGMGAAAVYLGEQADAKKYFEAIVQDVSVLHVYRAEAMFQLALLDVGERHYDSARERVKQVMMIPYAGLWVQKAQTLMHSIPGA